MWPQRRLSVGVVSQGWALCLNYASMLLLLQRGLSATCNCGGFDLSQNLSLLNPPKFFTSFLPCSNEFNTWKAGLFIAPKNNSSFWWKCKLETCNLGPLPFRFLSLIISSIKFSRKLWCVAQNVWSISWKTFGAVCLGDACLSLWAARCGCVPSRVVVMERETGGSPALVSAPAGRDCSVQSAPVAREKAPSKGSSVILLAHPFVSEWCLKLAGGWAGWATCGRATCSKISCLPEQAEAAPKRCMSPWKATLRAML